MKDWDRPITERLRVKLEPHEIITRAESLARHMAESDRMIDDFAAEKKAHTERMKERNALEQRMAQDIALGSEEREVSCVEVPRFADRLVDIVRTDTREVVRTRALQPDERQTEMFDEGAQPTAEPTKTKH